MAQSAAQLANIDQTTHGMSRTRTFAIWQAMLNRCYNPQATRFKNHGGRGIRVCKKWRRDFMAFFRDMGNAPVGLTLERKNNAGNYSKRNCIWATWTQQNRNRRDTRFAILDGVRKPIIEWGEIYGIKSSTIRARIDNFGWPTRRAITTPVIGRGRRPSNA